MFYVGSAAIYVYEMIHIEQNVTFNITKYVYNKVFS